MSWEFEQKFTSDVETANKYEVIWSGRDVWVFNQFIDADPNWATEFRNSDGELMTINRGLSLTVYNFWDYTNGNSSNTPITWANSDYERLAFNFYFDNNIHPITKTRVDLLACTSDSIVDGDKAPYSVYNGSLSAAKWYNRIYLLTGNELYEFDADTRQPVSSLQQLNGLKATAPDNIVSTNAVCVPRILITPEIPGELITPEIPGELITPAVEGVLITPEIPGELITPAMPSQPPTGSRTYREPYPEPNNVKVLEYVYDDPNDVTTSYGDIVYNWYHYVKDGVSPGPVSIYVPQNVVDDFGDPRTISYPYNYYDAQLFSSPLLDAGSGYQWDEPYFRIYIAREFVNDVSFVDFDPPSDWYDYGNVTGQGYWKYTVQYAFFNPGLDIYIPQPWGYVVQTTTPHVFSPKTTPYRHALRDPADWLYNSTAAAGITLLGYTPDVNLTRSIYHPNTAQERALMTMDTTGWSGSICIWREDPLYDGPSTYGNISQNDPILITDPDHPVGYWMWFVNEKPYSEGTPATPAVYGPPTPAVYNPEPQEAVYGPSTPAVYGPTTPAVYAPAHASSESDSTVTTPNSNLCAANGKLYFTSLERTPDTNQQWLCIYDLKLLTWTIVLLPGRHQIEKRHLVDGLDGYVWITNMNNHAVIKVDVYTNTISAVVRVNRHPYRLTCNQGKTLFVASDSQESTVRIYEDPDLALSYADVTNKSQDAPTNGFTGPLTGMKAIKTYDTTSGMISTVNQTTNAYASYASGMCDGEGRFFDDEQGYLWFINDNHIGRLRKTDKDFKTTYNKEEATPTPEEIQEAVGMIPVGATILSEETGGVEDGACTVKPTIVKSVLTPSFMYQRWNGSAFVNASVKPYLFLVFDTGDVTIYRDSDLVRKNLYQVRGTAMIATGEQQYYGDLP